MRVTLAAINRELAGRGHQAILTKAGGYFYFQGKDAVEWLDRTVRVPTLSSLTLEQWIGEFNRLKKLNADIAKSAAGPTRSAKGRK